MSVQQLWDQAWLESKGDTDLTNARVGGRATKANPNKEDITFWQTAGPKWVEAYIAWRKANPEKVKAWREAYIKNPINAALVSIYKITGLKKAEIPTELLEAQALIIQINREIRNQA